MSQNMKKHLAILFSALEQERFIEMLYRENPSPELMRKYLEAKEVTAQYRQNIRFYENTT